MLQEKKEFPEEKKGENKKKSSPVRHLIWPVGHSKPIPAALLSSSILSSFSKLYGVSSAVATSTIV
jgi:hypothetical protein